MRRRNVMVALLLFLLIVDGMLYMAVIYPLQGKENGTYNFRVPHDPIKIDGNSDLISQAQSEGWQGNGSMENPYVIRDYYIDSTGYSYGIYLGNVSLHFVVENCTVENAGGIGNNVGAVVLYNTSNGVIERSVLRSSDHGIYLNSSSGMVVRNSRIYGNGESGIYLDSSSGNTIYNNYFNNTQNVYFRGESSNSWSITPDYGPNVIHGPLIGGNYWAKPDGTGFSETSNADSMGFAPSYTLSTGNVDEHPLATGGKISGDITGCGYIDKPGVYSITADFDSDCKYGILIMASDVVLRGGGHWINKSSGNTYGDTRGIILLRDSGVKNVKIENVKMANWYVGLEVQDSRNVSVENARIENTQSSFAMINNAVNVTINSLTVNEPWQRMFVNYSRDVVLNETLFEQSSEGTHPYLSAYHAENLTVSGVASSGLNAYQIEFVEGRVLRILNVSNGGTYVGLDLKNSSDIQGEGSNIASLSASSVSGLNLVGGNINCSAFSDSAGIYLYNVSDSSFRGMRHEVGRYGTDTVVDSKNVTFQSMDILVNSNGDHNLFNINGGDGIRIVNSDMRSPTPLSAYSGYLVVIQGNVGSFVVENNTMHNYYGGIHTEFGATVRDGKIVNNTLFDLGGGEGIIVETGNVTVLGNRVRGAYEGIMAAGDNSRVENNTISNCTLGVHWVNSKNSAVNGNTISKAMIGIKIINVAFSEIRDNAITNSTYGLYFEPLNTYSTDTSAENLSVMDNRIEGVEYGIFMKYGLNITIADNYINDTVEDAIHVLHSRNVRVEENSINRVRNGLWIAMSDEPVIRGNEINDVKRHGLMMNSVDSPIIRGNEILNSSRGSWDYYLDDISNEEAFWAMDEGSGTTLVDHSGNGHDGEIYNGAWVSDRNGTANRALYFDGSGYAEVNMDVNYEQITVALWFNASDLSNGNPRIIANSHTDIDKKGFQIAIDESGTRMYADVGNGSAEGHVAYDNVFSLNTWYFVVIIYDGHLIKLYLNGALVDQEAFEGGPIASSGYPIDIGRNPVYDGDYFHGTVDEVRIYSFALDDTEIAYLYSYGLAQDMEAYWPLHEGGGNELVDHTGHGHNGTIYNATWTTGHEENSIAAYFDGTNYAEVPMSNLTIGYSQLTVTLWFAPFNLSTGNPRLIANSHTDVDLEGFQMVINSGGHSGFFDVGRGSDAAVGDLRADWNYDLYEYTWYFAALVYDGTSVKAYINGELVGEMIGDGPHTIEVSNYPLNIARNPAYKGDYFNGSIEEVRIYSRALSYQEVMYLYGHPPNSTAIHLANTNHAEIYGNVVGGYYNGIALYDSHGGKVHNNKIENCTSYGVLALSYTYDNVFYNNSFYFNHGSTNSYDPAHVQAYDSGGNQWNTPSYGDHGYGNYWYDWANNNASNDGNGDGIVDWPYNLDGGAKDSYPLTNPTVIPEFSSLLWVLPLMILAFLMRREPKLRRHS